MNITFEKADQILQTLPISYYLKRKIDVKLDYTTTSYFDLLHDNLVVSYNQLSKANIDENDIEKDIRCLLYHEVSHALLTPEYITNTKFINIVEDERIETICKNYYLDTNFKEFVKKINDYHGQKPTTFVQFFYIIVRFHDGPKHLIDELYQLINKHSSLTRTSCWDDTTSYIDDIYTFVKLAEDEWYKQLENDENKESANDSSNNSSDDSSNNSSDTENEQNQDETNIQNSYDNTQSEHDDIFDTTDFSNNIVTAIDDLTYECNTLIDTNLQNEFRQILLNKQKTTKMNGSAINSYSGIFDPRSCGRNDYKYFVQKNRNGNVKRFSKIKLNLFIDTSGSFCNSEKTVNRMLFNLSKLEKQTNDFEFDVISMNEGETILNKNDRFISCDNCNNLTNDIFNIFKKVQSSNAVNVNLVMFDGFAFSDKYYLPKEVADKDASNFKAFNHSNTIIISDMSNSLFINKYCNAAKTIIVKNDYANLLISNVINNLKYGLK